MHRQYVADTISADFWTFSCISSPVMYMWLGSVLEIQCNLLLEHQILFCNVLRFGGENDSSRFRLLPDLNLTRVLWRENFLLQEVAFVSFFYIYILSNFYSVMFFFWFLVKATMIQVFFFQDLTLVPELGYFWSLKISLFQCNVARAFSRVCSLDLVFDKI